MPQQKKKQHVIPKCYLRAWCDPQTPPGQHPYIWRISKDGATRTKRSPEKSFTATDKYTIRLPNGERNLVIEDTLSRIESHFVRVLPKIRKRQRLSATDRAHLCLFAAAMHSRTSSAGRHWAKQFGRLHEVVVDLEQAHNAPPKTSLETARMVERAHQEIIVMSLKFETPLLFQMNMCVLTTDDDLGFVTSDRPCLWFNPQAYKWPPIYRSPGLGQRHIEVTLPLTPQHLLLISHRPTAEYVRAIPEVVSEVNRRNVLSSDQEFVSWKGEVRPHWFVWGEAPDDSWEKSEHGKQALARALRRETKHSEDSSE